MGIARRFRWAIVLGGLKMLAAAMLFVYSKHKAAGPPAPPPVPVRERLANRIPSGDSGAHPPQCGERRRPAN